MGGNSTGRVAAAQNQPSAEAGLPSLARTGADAHGGPSARGRNGEQPRHLALHLPVPFCRTCGPRVSESSASRPWTQFWVIGRNATSPLA